MSVHPVSDWHAPRALEAPLPVFDRYPQYFNDYLAKNLFQLVYNPRMDFPCIPLHLRQSSAKSPWYLRYTN